MSNRLPPPYSVRGEDQGAEYEQSHQAGPSHQRAEDPQDHHHQQVLGGGLRLCNDVFLEVKQKIYMDLRTDLNRYKLFLIGVIVQGVLRMFEDKLMVRCLPEDEKIVEEVIEDCVETFNSVMDFQLGRKYTLELILDRNNPLRPHPPHKIFLDKQE